jgi:hypothetical protein
MDLIMASAAEKARQLGVHRVTMEHVLHAWLTMDREGDLARAMHARGVTAEVVARLCRFADVELESKLAALTHADKVAMHRKLTELLAAQDVAGTGL